MVDTFLLKILLSGVLQRQKIDFVPTYVFLVESVDGDFYLPQHGQKILKKVLLMLQQKQFQIIQM